MKIIRHVEQNGWESLKERGIGIKEYEEGFKVLNYSQIDARKDDEIACECRGLIVRDDMKVVCRPFSRFFNFGEGGSGNFDFSNCSVFEKADGSMIKVWFNERNDQWEMGTRNSAFAENEMSHVDGSPTFRSMVLKAMRRDEYLFQQCMDTLDRGTTYVFEYCSPKNRIVTRYAEDVMVYLGSINNETGEQNEKSMGEVLNCLHDEEMNVRLPILYEASSSEELLSMVNTLDGLKEGFVVYDNNTGDRVKIKSSMYVAVHHLRGEGTPTQKRAIEVVVSGESSEVLAYFPEFSELINPVAEKLDKMILEANELFDKTGKIESQKEFAMAVKDTLFSNLLFKARKDKTSVEEAFKQLTDAQRFSCLERYVNS